MKELAPEHIIAAVSRATQEVFETMLGMDVQLGLPKEESVNQPELDGVMALVGVGGPWVGSGRISCSAALSCRLASAMLMAEYTEVDEDVLDAMSEIANMIIGSVKTTLEELLGPLALSIPTVVYGRSYRTRCAGVRKWTMVPAHCGNEQMNICFFLVKSQGVNQVLARPAEMYA